MVRAIHMLRWADGIGLKQPYSACGWDNIVNTTSEPALVTCGSCRRTVYFRSVAIEKRSPERAPTGSFDS